MQTHRWFNPSQPQTLQSAVILLYLNAGIALLFGLAGGGLVALLPLAGAGGAYGMANERKWGYYLSCVVAILPLAINVMGILKWGYTLTLGTDAIITILFQVLLVALLFHPMTTTYRRIWFK